MAFTAYDFAAKWRNNTRKERSVSQEHFIDLCRLIGHETPGDNRDGTLAFEAGANKSTGGQGWADVWKRGYFGWEYKGPNADLDKAYQQLQQYRDSLENPPLLVVSDIQTIVIHTNFINTVKRTITLTLDDLQTPAGLQTLRQIFTNPEALRPTVTTQQVTEQAAAEFAKLATLLQRYGEQPQAIAHFLIRLLFCLFAEDTGLLPGGLFSRIIEQTRHRAPEFAAFMRELFSKMATGGFFGLERIRYFNGNLFDNDTVLELDSEGMAILGRVSKLDWSAIEPSIFGTLFERSLDPAKRSQLGAHYTSRDDIMLIVEPVLMQPLRRRWAEVRQQAQSIAAQRDAATGAKRTRLENELTRTLIGFVDEIANTKVLDPACGSGNFLYVALKQLLDLEQQVINTGADLGLSRMMPVVSPEQLHGIEINAYAHELAQITVWIGYLQWLRDNGYGELSEPILQPLKTIQQMDAILAFDDQGNPYEPEWPEADVIIGNPPFLGGQKLLRELGEQYVGTLRNLYEGRVSGGADLVIYWFEKTRSLIEEKHIQRAGLLATQAIRSGVNRKVLERIVETGSIFMAWSDRPWTIDGADVRVSMIGFDQGFEKEICLNGILVSKINSDLTSMIDLTLALGLCENRLLCYRCDEKGGPFDIDLETAMIFIKEPLNKNGRPNTDVVRPYINAYDITHRLRGKWIIDFGVNMSEAEAALYKKPFEYVVKHVKPIRDISRNERERTYWWLHRRPAPDMRQAIASLTRYIATPRVAKHRLFLFMKLDYLPDSRIAVIARDDDYFFGVLHSRLHEVWSLATSSRHGVGNDPTYNNTTCFETYPFPWPPGTEPTDDPRVVAIGEAAKQLVALRDAWLHETGLSAAEEKKRTLTNLYNARPAWLAEAHAALDRAVFDAYGWPADLSDDQILERLLVLNLERAAAGGTAAAGDAEAEEPDDE